MADEREQQIWSRLAAATPGPWRVEVEGEPECWDLIGAREGIEYILGTIGGYYEEGKDPETGLAVPADNSPDAELIGNAPADLTYLLDALAVAREENGRLREALERHGEHRSFCMQMDREAWTKAGRPEPVPCTCGFWAALAREDGDGR